MEPLLSLCIIIYSNIIYIFLGKQKYKNYPSSALYHSSLPWLPQALFTHTLHKLCRLKLFEGETGLIN